MANIQLTLQLFYQIQACPALDATPHQVRGRGRIIIKNQQDKLPPVIRKLAKLLAELNSGNHGILFLK